MNRVYISKEIAVPFNLVYNLHYDKESMEHKDFLKDIFTSLLFEMECRINGAELLLEKDVGASLDPYIAIDDDNSYSILYDIFSEDDELIFNEDCKICTEKRLQALKTFYDAMDNLYKLFYNPNLQALKDIAKSGDLNG